jgi:hypothetical protein
VGLVHAWRSLDDGLSRDAVDAPAKNCTIMYIGFTSIRANVHFKAFFYPELFRALLKLQINY